MNEIPVAPDPHWLFGSLRPLVADPAAFLTRLSTCHGDIVRFRLFHQKAVLLSRPDLIREVLEERADEFPKDPRDTRILSRLLGHGLVTAVGREHQEQRQIIAPAFQGPHIAAYADTIVRYANDLVDAWLAGETRDMAYEMEKLTMYIVVKIFFDLNKVELTSTGDEIGEAMKELQILTNRDIARPRFLPQWLFPFEYRRRRHYRGILDDAVNGIIRRRRAETTSRRDLLGMLLQARHENGSGLTDVEIRDQLVTMFFAGHETTSSALSWTWYYLARHPELAVKLHEELDCVLAGRLPVLEDLENLRYTTMVLKELMRIQPPVWIFSRTVAADTTIGGYAVNKGTLLLISPYVMHHHPDYFADPGRFAPERFKPDVDELPGCTYLPFGGGPRACIGDRFAMVEAGLILAVMARKYRFAADPDQEIQAQRLITTKFRFGLRMQACYRHGGTSAGAAGKDAPDLRRQVSDWSFRDPYTRRQSLWRKTVAFRTISKIARVDSQEEFIRRVSAVQRQAHERGGHARTIGIWAIEKLSFALVTGKASGWTFNDERVPASVQPVAHAGLGIGAIYRYGLRPLELTRFIEAHAHPDYLIYAYESMGTGWSALSKRWFREYFHLVAGTQFFRSGLYDPHEFLRRFPTSLQRAIAHGLGRGLYFNSLSMQAAVSAVRKRDYLHASNLIRGIAFACTIVNYKDFPHSLDMGYTGAVDEALARETRMGIRAALLLWEWTYPGFLDGCDAENDYQRRQLDDAREVASSERYTVSF